jgi:hypothetical protein
MSKLSKTCTNWGEKHTRWWPCMCNKSEKWHKEFTLLHDIERLTICHSLAIFFKEKLSRDSWNRLSKDMGLWSPSPRLPRQPGPSVSACVESNDDGLWTLCIVVKGSGRPILMDEFVQIRMVRHKYPPIHLESNTQKLNTHSVCFSRSFYLSGSVICWPCLPTKARRILCLDSL